MHDPSHFYHQCISSVRILPKYTFSQIHTSRSINSRMLWNQFDFVFMFHYLFGSFILVWKSVILRSIINSFFAFACLFVCTLEIKLLPVIFGSICFGCWLNAHWPRSTCQSVNLHLNEIDSIYFRSRLSPTFKFVQPRPTLDICTSGIRNFNQGWDFCKILRSGIFRDGICVIFSTRTLFMQQLLTK